MSCVKVKNWPPTRGKSFLLKTAAKEMSLVLHDHCISVFHAETKIENMKSLHASKCLFGAGTIIHDTAVKLTCAASVQRDRNISSFTPGKISKISSHWNDNKLPITFFLFGNYSWDGHCLQTYLHENLLFFFSFC